MQHTFVLEGTAQTELIMGFTPSTFNNELLLHGACKSAVCDESDMYPSPHGAYLRRL
jgi:hypothetical protein